MLPVIEAFKKKYEMQQLIVIADAGLMSNKNITALLDRTPETGELRIKWFTVEAAAELEDAGEQRSVVDRQRR